MIWLTRDSEGGELADVIMVWDAPPERFVDSKGAFWSCGVDAKAATWHRVSTARKMYATLPDTDRECVRYEGTPRHVPRPEGKR